jgi:hypothetical protein
MAQITTTGGSGPQQERQMTITAKYKGTCVKCGGQISAGDKIEWENGKGSWHTTCQAKAEPIKQTADPNAIKISGGSGYGCQGFSVGKTYLYRGDYVTVMKSGKRYYREDGMSFGVGDESGHVYWADCRPATEAEIAPLKAAQAQRESDAARREELKAFMLDFSKTGEYPAGDNIPEGDTVPIGNGQTIYGGGEWFVIGPELTWYVVNNGHDGDDWSRNNVRTGGAGAIGWTKPTSQELTGTILRLTGYDLAGEKAKAKAKEAEEKAKAEAFTAEWTLAITMARREQWNLRMVEMKKAKKKLTWEDFVGVEKEFGFTFAGLKEAVAYHKL